MVVRCEVCNSKEVNLEILPAFNNIKPKPFCSRECELICNYKKYAYSSILFLFFPPFMIVSIIKSIKGFKLKRKREKLKALEKSLCFHCGKEVETSSKSKTVCMNCGEIVHYCDLCQEHILFKDKVLQIEPCGHIFHKDELLEWTEKNDICPKCSVKIEFVDFQPD